MARRAPELARSFALDGRIDARSGFSADDTTGLTLLDVSLKSANGRLTLPALYAEPLAYDQLSLNAGYDAAAGAIKVSQLRLDTGPIAATVTATAALGEPVIRLTADAVVTGMPVSELERYWPRRIGTDAWNWVTRNLENGSVSKATSHLEGEIDGTALWNDLKVLNQLGVTRGTMRVRV